MTEQTNTIETPTPDQPRDERGQFMERDSVVDDVIFGSQPPDALDAHPEGFTPRAHPGEETSAPQEGAPEVQGQPETPQPQDVTTTDNEEVRYQYWQSQADKSKNELTQMRHTNQLLQNQLNIMSQGQPSPQEQAPEQSQEFPPPPERPQRPVGYNREESYSDPQSQSAQFDNAVDGWRDDMDEYNRLHAEYNRELALQDRRDVQEAQQREANFRAAKEQEYRQVQDISGQIRQKYQADDATIQDFIQKYSNDESITIDNLWRLYQMDNGNVIPQGQAPTATPSPEFQQTQRAQQATTPMGVVTGQSQSSAGSTTDKIMDSMISDLNGQNPF